MIKQASLYRVLEETVVFSVGWLFFSFRVEEG
jgi:hypothetical protein